MNPGCRCSFQYEVVSANSYVPGGNLAKGQWREIALVEKYVSSLLQKVCWYSLCLLTHIYVLNIENEIQNLIE